MNYSLNKQETFHSYQQKYILFDKKYIQSQLVSRYFNYKKEFKL